MRVFKTGRLRLALVIFLLVSAISSTVWLDSINAVQAGSEPVNGTLVSSRPSGPAAIGDGVTAHGADPWHDANLEGDGVKVGVIDFGGFDFVMDRVGDELPPLSRIRA